MKTKKHVRALILAAAMVFVTSGTASATAIDFWMTGITISGGILPTTQSYVPEFPMAGQGDIDFSLGTGWVTLPALYVVFIDVNNTGVNDARIFVQNWKQNITSIDGAGNITTTAEGTSPCQDLSGGGIGSLVCGSAPANVAPWPPVGAGSSATIDKIAQTITVVDASAVGTAGTITQTYFYAPVPEPGTALLVGSGLIGPAASRKRRNAA